MNQKSDGCVFSVASTETFELQHQGSLWMPEESPQDRREHARVAAPPDSGGDLPGVGGEGRIFPHHLAVCD